MEFWIEDNSGNPPRYGEPHYALYNRMKNNGAHAQYHNKLEEACPVFSERNGFKTVEVVESMIEMISYNRGIRPAHENRFYSLYNNMRGRGSHPQYHARLAAICPAFAERTNVI